MFVSQLITYNFFLFGFTLTQFDTISVPGFYLDLYVIELS